jgi:hypothetical protein
MASDASVLVPAGPYSCVVICDKLHTLRRTVGSLPTNDRKYIADASGGQSLIGGNLNDDAYIDIQVAADQRLAAT